MLFFIVIHDNTIGRWIALIYPRRHSCGTKVTLGKIVRKMCILFINPTKKDGEIFGFVFDGNFNVVYNNFNRSFIFENEVLCLEIQDVSFPVAG